MQWNRKTPVYLLLAALCVLTLVFFRKQTALMLRLVLGALVVAFILCPLSDLLSRRLHLKRTAAILISFALAGLVLLGSLVLLIPAFFSQLRTLVSSLPAVIESLQSRVQPLIDRLAQKGLSLPDIPWEKALSTLTPVLGGTASLAGSVASVFTSITLVAALAFYFLRDREIFSLQLELLVPASFRKTAVRMAHAIRHEMNTYLRSQAVISLIVGALSAIGLMLLGIQSFLVLGLLVGLFNLIPYFGPLLGGIPTVLLALTQGSLNKALLAALVLFLVQQIDNLFISPRVMGSVTGLHPAIVLAAITLGGSFSGLPGMLFAVPAVLMLRAVSRNWASRPETCQKRTEY